MMKNRIGPLLACLVLVTFPGASFAAHCDSQRCVAKVKLLYPHENGTIFVHADADMSSLNCTLSQGGMELQASNGSHDEIYSMLLAAQIAGRELVMRAVANSNGKCRLSYTTMSD